MEYDNPYMGETFFGFFIQLTLRLLAFLKGNLPLVKLASDEIQLIVLIGVTISASLLGSFLVLRKMTMLANALSHTILLGIVGAFMITQWITWDAAPDFHAPLNIPVMLFASLVMGILTTWLSEFLTKTVRLQEDASIGLVFTSFFALGILLVTLFTRSSHVGTEVVMGNVDALQLQDCQLVLTTLGINVVLLLLFFKEYQLTTFDSALAKSLGISPVIFNYLLMIQVSATVIAGFRAVGVLMVLALITAPPLTARLLTHDLKKMLFGAIGIGILACLLGVALSRHLLSVYGLALSTGGLVVCVAGALFALVFLWHIIDSPRKKETIANSRSLL